MKGPTPICLTQKPLNTGGVMCPWGWADCPFRIGILCGYNHDIVNSHDGGGEKPHAAARHNARTMTPKEVSLICQRALDTFGAITQIDQTIEEMAELTVALNHNKRARAKDGEVVTEIADVLIMCLQMMLLFGEREVKAEMDRKLERLEDMLIAVGKHQRRNDDEE